MTSEQYSSAVRARFHDLIEVPEGVRVIYDNAPSVSITTPFIRFSVKDGTSDIFEFGNGNTFQTVCVAYAMIFTAVGQAEKEARVLADKIVAAFRMQTAGGVRYRTPSITSVGRQGPFHQINVSIPFWAFDRAPAA